MMTQEWWFQIYTRTYLRRALLWTVMALVGDWALFSFSPVLGAFSANFMILPFIPFLQRRETNSLRKNLDFHLISVEAPELKRALLLDFGICLLSSFFLSSLFVIGSKFSGGAHSQADYSIAGHVTWVELVFFCFIFSMFCFGVSMNDKSKTPPQDGVLKSLVDSFIWTGIITVFAVPFVYILGLAHSSMLSLFGSFALGITVYLLKQSLHEVPGKFRVLPAVRYLTGSVLSTLVLFSIFAQFSKRNAFDPSLTPGQRATSFAFSGIFAPDLDEESYRAIEPVIRGSFFSLGHFPYEKTSFDPSTLGVDFYITKTDIGRLSSFVYYGNPSKEFLIQLYDHFVHEEKFWSGNQLSNDSRRVNVNRFQRLAYERWPKHEKLPERFIAKLEKIRLEKTESARDVASDKPLRR